MHEGILLACQVGNRGQYQDVHTEDSNAVWEIVKFVGHDGAREFATTSLKFFYEDEGIEVTVPYAHQTSRTAEWAIQTIVTIGHSMLHHATLDKFLCCEAAMLHARIGSVTRNYE